MYAAVRKINNLQLYNHVSIMSMDHSVQRWNEVHVICHTINIHTCRHQMSPGEARHESNLYWRFSDEFLPTIIVANNRRMGDTWK